MKELLSSAGCLGGSLLSGARTTRFAAALAAGNGLDTYTDTATECADTWMQHQQDIKDNTVGGAGRVMDVLLMLLLLFRVLECWWSVIRSKVSGAVCMQQGW